ncbi:Tryptophan--tRNA ligase, cytoplasmic [Beauveria bassiana]|uniref:tryptophan--tRNA ligase n=1 Tax=Beauveria bassiana TaxID=176275 RepID=A0A2N6NE40_BEABA|nr:Tryptophan--tRNA ligase, cytoplasmic [Beauveria bassiana]
MAAADATAVTPEDPAAPQQAKQDINPWSVSGEVGEDGKVKAIDYRKLIDEFGTSQIDDALLARFEQVTGQKPHRFMRRGIFFSHRDMHAILDRYEKYLFSEKRTVDEVIGYSKQNCKDIIAAGFDMKKTFIFSDFEYVGGAFYKNIVRFAKRVNFNTAKAVFGFDGSSNIGKIHFASIQGATAFASSFPHIFGTDEAATAKIPCLIPCAIDQDPYFRLTRDCAAGLKYAKPSLIHMRFLDALRGPGSKMSASDDTSAIFLSDSAKAIKNKVNKYAFSGGRETIEEHRERGGNADVDVSYQYLQFFMEDDELKAICIENLQKYVAEFQERRAKATDDVVAQFMAVRPLEWQGNPRVPRADLVVPVEGAASAAEGSAAAEGGDGKLTKNQMKKLLKEQQIVAKKAEKEAAKAKAAGDAA